jgi:hypothetical protein
VLFLNHWFVNQFLAGREIFEAGTIASIDGGSYWSLAESATTIWADIVEYIFCAVCAKRTLKTTDAGINRICG